MADFFVSFVVLFLCFILDLIFFPVISSFQDVGGWKLRRIARDLPQAQKRNSYKISPVSHPLNTEKTLITDHFIKRHFYNYNKNKDLHLT